MKPIMRIIYVLLILLMILPCISMAEELIDLNGVTINLNTNEKLEGYILAYWSVTACDKNKDNSSKWSEFLKREREFQFRDKDKRAVTFIGKLVKINNGLYAAKSSVKEINIDDIKSIESACRKWSDTSLSAFSGIPRISDYMAEYISNHKMIASYTFDAEDPKLSPEEYAYGQHTTYLSYNPKYPHQRLKKERKIIDKMSADVLNQNKLVRFTWADD